MADKSGRVLIVDDDADVLQAARLFLKQHLENVTTETDPEKIPGHLSDRSHDVILLDMNFSRDVASGREGFDWLGRILKIDPEAVVILITAYGGVELAVQAIKKGAADFVLKPWQNEKLLATISAGIRLRRSRVEVASHRSREKQLADDIDQKYRHIIGRSPGMEEVFGAVAKVAGTDANVLILGENGTGKELIAREIHRQSGRAGEVFISVDLGAIPGTLFESELFGHKKGAFTDARADRAGRFETASAGTLFLDEIGNLPLIMQPKLLAVLENRTLRRIGSNVEVPIDIRLICATNRSIYEMVAENQFRQDLLYRVNTVEIKLPPLRERIDDIPLLVEHFLGIYSRKYQKNKKKVPASTVKSLQQYGWPGNVREVQHAVERAVIMSERTVLTPDDFFLAGKRARRDGLVLDTFNLDEVEKTVILKALARHGSNISHAARALGLTRASLYRRMKKYGL